MLCRVTLGVSLVLKVFSATIIAVEFGSLDSHARLGIKTQEQRGK